MHNYNRIMTWPGDLRKIRAWIGCFNKLILINSRMLSWIELYIGESLKWNLNQYHGKSASHDNSRNKVRKKILLEVASTYINPLLFMCGCQPLFWIWLYIVKSLKYNTRNLPLLTLYIIPCLFLSVYNLVIWPLELWSGPVCCQTCWSVLRLS